MDVESLEKSIQEDIGNATDFEALEQARIRFLGRKGQVTRLLRDIKVVEPAERPRLGQAANRLMPESRNTSATLTLWDRCTFRSFGMCRSRRISSVHGMPRSKMSVLTNPQKLQCLRCLT